MAEEQTRIDRELPHSREAEDSVIGSMLVENDTVADVCAMLKADDFFHEPNSVIFAAIADLFDENIPVDVVTVSNRLNQNNQLEGIGGVPYLSSLILNVPTTENVEYYANIIKDKSKLRKLIFASRKILNYAYKDDDPTDKIIDKSEREILDISSDLDNSAEHISDIIPIVYDDYIKKSQMSGDVTGIPTGFRRLNHATGGLHDGELIIIAGRPGMGKSSLAVNIAEHAAIKENIPVAIFNLEMPKTQIVNRIISSQALVDSQSIRNGDFKIEDWQNICEVIDKISLAPIYIDDKSTINVREIKAICKRLKQTKKLGMVVIDYLQLMEGQGREENRQNEISKISRGLKVMAKELNIPVIALSQMSRNSEQKNRTPMLSDLRESGAIEQDADIVMFLYRKEDTMDKSLVDVNIAKNRSGSIQEFQLGWQGKYTKFVDVNEQNLEE